MRNRSLAASVLLSQLNFINITKNIHIHLCWWWHNPLFCTQLRFFWSLLKAAVSSKLAGTRTYQAVENWRANKQRKSLIIKSPLFCSGRTALAMKAEWGEERQRVVWRKVGPLNQKKKSLFFMYNEWNPLKMQDREIWISFPPSSQSKSDLETIKTTMDTETDFVSREICMSVVTQEYFSHMCL